MLKRLTEALARSRAPPRTNTASAVSKHNRAILAAEYELAFGHSLSHMRGARDDLRTAIPSCPLLEALEEK